MFCYFCVSAVIVVGLVRGIVQPVIELTKKERRFEWV